MFRGCRNLKELDVSNWDTSNVTTMESMFDGRYYRYCGLTNLDVSNWDTSNVTNMEDMFY
jgi:surface protein